MKKLTLALMTNAITFSLCSFFEPGFYRSMGSPPGSIETAGGGSGSGSGQTSLLAALAAERDAAMEREAAEAAAAERVAREFRGLFSNIPRVRGARDCYRTVFLSSITVHSGEQTPAPFVTPQRASSCP